MARSLLKPTPNPPTNGTASMPRAAKSAATAAVPSVLLSNTIALGARYDIAQRPETPISSSSASRVATRLPATDAPGDGSGGWS